MLLPGAGLSGHVVRFELVREGGQEVGLDPPVVRMVEELCAAPAG